MAKFWKDVLKPGRYLLKNGTVSEFTDADCAHLSRRVGEMLGAGLSIPLVWGHQPGVHAVTPGEQLALDVKSTLGWLEGADLTPDGRARVLSEVPLEEDARRLGPIRFCSPEILTDWTDGTGRLWPGRSITHVAVTARPVNPDQRPFIPAPPYDGAWLSLDDIVTEGRKMPDEPPDKGEKKPPDAPPEKKPDGDGDKGGPGPSTVAALAQALRDAGLNIPDGVPDIEHLLTAVKACAPAKPPEDDDMSDPQKKGAAPPVKEETMPILMSLDGSDDPARRRLARTERADLVRRAHALVGSRKVTKPVADALVKELSAERLSLDPEGGLVGGKALAKLEAYEALESNPFAERFGRDGLREEPHPADADGAEEKELLELASAQAAKVSVQPRGRGRA